MLEPPAPASIRRHRADSARRRACEPSSSATVGTIAKARQGACTDDLKTHFGEGEVFMDVAGLEAGRDYRRAIDDQVASCGVLLAIVGRNWLTAIDERGARRLDDPMDFVRLETASA